MARTLADKLGHALAQPFELMLPEDAGVQRVMHHGAASVGVTVFGPQDHDAAEGWRVLNAPGSSRTVPPRRPDARECLGAFVCQGYS